MKKQTAVEWFYNNIKSHFTHDGDLLEAVKMSYQIAKEMEKEQTGYTKEDILRAGEMGEVNHHDTKHIVSYLDEAKQYNEIFNTNEE